MLKENNKRDMIIQKFPVYVFCMTYNHAPYIKDALDGFALQKTDFPYVCIVCDDASIDGTGNVIMQYVRQNFNVDSENNIKEETEDYFLFYTQHKSNKNCFFSVYLLKYNHFEKKDKTQYFKRWTEDCKYMANCEGDDYWISPTKLQSQYDFLEANSDYGMCYTDFNMRYGGSLHERPSLIKNEPNAFKSEYTLEEWIVERGYVGPMTWFVRTALWNSIPTLKTPDGTFVYFAWFLKESKAYCLKELTTATYRVLEKSASHSQDVTEIYEKRILGMYEIQCTLIKLLYPQQLQRERLQRIVDEQFYKIGLRWFIALNKVDKIKKAQQFNYEHTSFLWDVELKLSNVKVFRKIWKIFFKPILRIRRRWVRVNEYSRTRKIKI